MINSTYNLLIKLINELMSFHFSHKGCFLALKSVDKCIYCQFPVVDNSSRGGGGGGGCKNSGSLSASNEISVDEKNPLIATDVHMQ